MQLLFLSCLKASKLIEKKFHVGLSWTEKMQLKAHKMMCGACTNYQKQSLIIENGISSIHKSEPSDNEIEELKKLISKKLENSH